MSKTPKQELPLAVFLIAITIGGGYYTQVRGPLAEQTKLQAEAEKTSAPAAAEKGPEVIADEKTRSEATRALPATSDPKQLQQAVRAAAKKSKVRISKVAPQGGKVAVSVEASGTFAGLGALVADLGDNARFVEGGQLRAKGPLYVVKDLSIRQKDEEVTAVFLVSYAQ